MTFKALVLPHFLCYSLILFSQSHLTAQEGIELPKVNYVSADFLEDYITVSIDSSGTWYIENVKTDTANFRNLFREALIFKVKYNNLLLSITTVRLIVDKNTTYDKLEALLYTIRSFGLLKIVFICNTSEIEIGHNIQNLGCWQRLNPVENSQSIVREVEDSLNTELAQEIQKELVISDDLEKESIPVIPPPPPPPLFPEKLKTTKAFKNFYKVVKIYRDSFDIDGMVFPLTDFGKQIKHHIYVDGIKVVLAAPTSSSRYQDIIWTLSEYGRIMNDLREEVSLIQWEKPYSSLDFKEQRAINSRYPYIFIFDEN